MPFVGKNGLAQFEGYNYVTENAEKHLPTMTKVVGWNIRLQPVLYPIAAFVRDHSIGKEFFSISEPTYKLLDDMDRTVLGWI
ncbi:hypothetical protein [Methylomicrobium sp. Wu6]|uniref:hypothetical protein n=1 Tax=Methylomicrobium sp. Wu6 TaxID=3107928 RepID=UPI002DD69545|nr:hypothetical protein [Methylomicrobium sp. Wu6]MEC4749045.1 hypothetical protein [Methylomicrobium sp. Wu6]